MATLAPDDFPFVSEVPLMFGQIQPTPYDLRFEILGVPIRVHPIFWASSVWLAWEPNEMSIVLVRVLCIFLAILVHEMGHALMTRRFGWQPEIVLYILGGYATSVRHTTWKDIAVSAAGPGAGFLLLLAIWAPGRYFGLIPPELRIMRLETWELAVRHGARVTELLHYGIDFSLFIGFVWNVVNLLPVLPLDGGQISREYWNWAQPRNGMRICLQLSVFASGAVAAWSALSWMNRGAPWNIGRLVGLDSLFLGLMFGYLCYQSYQQLQNIHGRNW